MGVFKIQQNGKIVSFEENKLKENSSPENEKLEAAWKLICLADALGIGKHTILEASPKKLEKLLLWINELSEKEHGPIWLDAYEQGYINELICKLKTSFYNKEEKNVQLQRPLAQLMFCIDVRSEPFRRNLELMGNYETYGFAGFFRLIFFPGKEQQKQEGLIHQILCQLPCHNDRDIFFQRSWLSIH